MEALLYLLPIAAFVFLYRALRRRGTEDGAPPPSIGWGWLAAIFALAAAAAIAGALSS